MVAPASVPWVVSVGGTILSIDGKSNRSTGVAWSTDEGPTECNSITNFKWGSGGGLSIFFQRPAWQQGKGVQSQYSNGSRQVPDLAAVADNLPVYWFGYWSRSRSTSAAAPIWAAAFAVANQGLISKTNHAVYGPQIFYKAASRADSSGQAGGSSRNSPYYDIQKQEGKNLYYPATANWDFVTGLGAPNLENFEMVLEQIVKSSKE